MGGELLRGREKSRADPSSHVGEVLFRGLRINPGLAAASYQWKGLPYVHKYFRTRLWKFSTSFSGWFGEWEEGKKKYEEGKKKK